MKAWWYIISDSFRLGDKSDRTIRDVKVRIKIGNRDACAYPRKFYFYRLEQTSRVFNLDYN